MSDATPHLFSPATWVVRAFYGAQATLLAYTLIAQCLLTHHQHRSLANTFSYFTIQSNVFVLVTATILCLRPSVSGNLWRFVRMCALCGITVTGLVYTFILAPYVHLTGWALAYDYVFHYVMPISTVVGFVFVGPRLRLETRDLAYLGWPVAWLVYTMVRGGVFHPEFVGFGEPPSHYPYRFLDIDRTGTGEVVGAIVFIALLLIGIGFAYIHGERRLERA